MKKLFLAFAICTAISGCKDEGERFIGTWAHSEQISNTQTLTETIVVTKTNHGYQAISNTDPETWGEIKLDLVPESDSVLIDANTKKKRLELSAENKITSHLRNKPLELTRAN
ncbi:hypothetical protein D9M68_252380 [compost metagenome]